MALAKQLRIKSPGSNSLRLSGAGCLATATGVFSFGAWDMTKITRTLKSLEPSSLIKHPLSLRIYGEQSDAGFDESIKARGIDEPIVTAADGMTIISGVRRRNGEIKAGLKKVPIIVREDLAKDIDIREAIIEANRHNEQTMEAKAEAYAELKAIETERAKARQATSTGGKSPQPMVNVPQAEKGAAGDKAAKKFGISRKTADKAVAVVAKIKEATELGKVTTAEDLRQTLNKSVSKAHEVSVHSEEYTAAFDTLFNGIQKLIVEKPSRATEACVIAMSNKDVNEQVDLALHVRKEIDNVKTFDQLVFPKKQGGTRKPLPPKKKGKSKMAPTTKNSKAPVKATKESPEPLATDILDLVKESKNLIDHLAEINGGRGDEHANCMLAISELTESLNKMKGGEQ